MADYNYSEADIQKYILGELTADEVLKFEKTMKENQDFAIEVNNQIKIAEGIEYYGAQQFKSRIKDIYDKVRPEIISNAETKKSPFSLAKIIALTLFLILITFFFFNYFTSQEPQSSEAVYATYFQKYDWNTNLRSDQTSSLELDKAFENYNSNSFKEAMINLQTYLNSDPKNIPARLALANCHLQNDKPQQAIIHLKSILSQDDVLYRDQANWYLALAYLKLGELDQAQLIFNQFSNDTNSDYNRGSQEILKKLK